MVLMPTSSRQTNMRSSHGEKNKFEYVLFPPSFNHIIDGLTIQT